MNKDVTDLILAEYRRFSEAFWRNEEVGEKRVNYYLGLITAVFAGLITLGTGDFAKNHPATVLGIALGAQSAVLAVGWVTHLRMKKRTAVTDEYKDILNALRAALFAQTDVRPYHLPFATGTRSLRSGGLPTMVRALNTILLISTMLTLAAFVVCLARGLGADAI